MINKPTWDDIYQNHPIRNNLIQFLNTNQSNIVFYSPEASDQRLDIARLVEEQARQNCEYIVIACDNKYALKMFAGNKNQNEEYYAPISSRNNSKNAYSKTELEQQLASNHITEYQFYYPYPNYQLPLAIYSDAYLPKRGELTNNLRNFGIECMDLFDESSAWDHIIEDQLFTTFTNSYLLVIGPKVRDEVGEILFSKYSNDRNPAFNIRTDILQDKNTRIVMKRAMGQEAVEHIHAMMKHYEQLQANYPDLIFNQCRLQDDKAYLEYLTGETLDELLVRQLQEQNYNIVLSTLRRYITFVTNAVDDNIVDVDMIFKNILVEDNQWTVIDYEWTFDKRNTAEQFVEQLTIPFVIYRSFYYFIEDNHIDREIADRLYDMIDVNEQQKLHYHQLEQEFQQYVSRNHKSLGVYYGEYGGEIHHVINQLLEQQRQNAIEVFGTDDNGKRKQYDTWEQEISDDQHIITIEVPEHLLSLDIVLGHSCMIVEIMDASINDENMIETLVMDGYNVYNEMYLFSQKECVPTLHIPLNGESGRLQLKLLIHNEGDNTSAAFASLLNYLQLKDIKQNEMNSSLLDKMKTMITKR